MNKLFKNDVYIKLGIILVGLLLYFVGFYFKEFSPSGSQSDFKAFVFKNIQFFRDDLISSIQNYGKLGDANYPFFYIFHAYLNPFSYDPDTYLFSTFSIGLLTFFFFFLSLKNLNFKQIDALTLSSLLLYLPWFSGRAFWGTASNLAWFFFLISILIFIKFKELGSNDNILKKIKITFLLCLFSSLTLYVKPIFIFFVIYIIYYNFINKKFIYLRSIFSFYLFFSIPIFLLIFYWGGIYDHTNSSIVNDIFNYKNILNNIPIIFSYFFFYLWPFFILKLIEEKKKDIIDFLKIFLIFFITLIILDFSNNLNYLKEYKLGGGAFIKLGYYLNDKYNIIFFTSSSFGFCFVVNYLKEKFLNNLGVIVLVLIFFGIPKFLYQDYFEPLIIILAFTKILNSNFNINSEKKIFLRLILIYGFFFFLYNQILFFN